MLAVSISSETLSYRHNFTMCLKHVHRTRSHDADLAPSSCVEYASANISPREDGNVKAGQLEDVCHEAKYRCVVCLWYVGQAVDANSLSRRHRPRTLGLSGRRRPCVKPLVVAAVVVGETR